MRNAWLRKKAEKGVLQEGVLTVSIGAPATLDTCSPQEASPDVRVDAA